MKVVAQGMMVCLMIASAAAAGLAQEVLATVSPGSTDQRAAQLKQRVETISASLAETQKQIEQSQRQMMQLQKEFLQLRQQMSAASPESSLPLSASSSVSSVALSCSAFATAPDVSAASAIEERQQTIEAALKLHDQTKVESTSKYPIRLTGLILFNGYSNIGVPDNTDMPAFAIRETPSSGNGNLGAGLRQTILGIEGNGPSIAGARTSANISVDFFSNVSYTSYGTSAGVVRMRAGSIDLDWANDSVQAGLVTPLISPLSPTSFATVAEPSMAGAGNLWTWAPQVRYTHRIGLRNGRRLQAEFGLWDSPSAGYNANQFFRTSSPGEFAKKPAYETRFSYSAAGDHGLQIGVGGYYSRQAYPGYQGYLGTETLDSWASTADWQIPLGRHFELSGEGYRGRAIGGLGGGVYKDVVTGTNPRTGANDLHGLNAIGGWTQWKTRFTPSLETNFSIGQDNGFARDFHAVVLSPTGSATQLRARNKMVVGNLIFRPKTYLILSPEYRRIWSWPITGAGSTLDVVTLSVGYQF